MEPRYDPIAIAERHAAIAVVMARVNAKRAALAQRIQASQVDAKDAHRRNETMPGYLGELWADFLAMPQPQQIKALRHDEFKGMAWQSLLQCSPYF